MLNENPFNWIGTKDIIGLPKWVALAFGILFILLGIFIWLYFYPKSKRNAELYKEKQLAKWKTLNKKRTFAKYKDTKMFLPPLEKVKLMFPIFISIMFCIVGIAWIVGNTLTSL